MMDSSASPRKKLQKRRPESQFIAGDSKRSKRSKQSLLSGPSKSACPQLEAKTLEKAEFSGNEEVVWAPLPKSKLLDKPKTSAVEAADHKANEGLLPPPNMEYLMRQPLTPLKWARPYNFSGFVLEDNSVVYVGTKKYEETLRQGFLNYLQGGKEDVDDFVARNFKDFDDKEKEEVEEAVDITRRSAEDVNMLRPEVKVPSMTNIPYAAATTITTTTTTTTRTINLQKLEVKNAPSLTTTTTTTTDGTVATVTTITGAAATSKHRAGFNLDLDGGRVSHSIGAEPAIQVLDVDEYILSTEKAQQEAYGGVIGTGLSASEQPAAYYCLSSSSDEDELPRVQVTGRSTLLHRVPAAGDCSRRCNKEPVPVSEEGATRTSQAASGVGGSGVRVWDDSLQTDLPEECPICGVALPLSWSQCEADEHIANCLSISINDLEDST